MTWYDVGLQVYYDGSTIYGAGPLPQDWFAQSNTGWYLDYSDGYIYQNPPTGGFEKMAEGWAGFNGLNDAYPHEHHMIITATGSGGCYAEDYFSGTLPNAAYWTVYSYT